MPRTAGPVVGPRLDRLDGQDAVVDRSRAQLDPVTDFGSSEVDDALFRVACDHREIGEHTAAAEVVVQQGHRFSVSITVEIAGHSEPGGEVHPWHRSRSLHGWLALPVAVVQSQG